MSLSSPQLPNPRGHAPLLRPNSLRRTMSIDVTWPEGRYGKLKVLGLARDRIFGQETSRITDVYFDELHVEIDTGKYIQAIYNKPEQPQLQVLTGVHTMSALRSKLRLLLTEQRAAGQPIYQLMNDITGVMVASEWAWASRKISLAPELRATRRANLAKMAGVCTGFSPNSSALHTDGTYQSVMAAKVIPLAHPQEPHGWHDLPNQGSEASFRRARRLDLWLDDDIHIESTFQDSATTETGGRHAVHEYTVSAVFERKQHKLLSIEATPHILPFPECPAAVAKLQRLVGVSALELRDEVSRSLRKVDGCTHLNDAARALAEAPALIQQLLSAR